MASAVSDSLRHVLDRAVHDSAFPGAYAAVGTSAGVLAEYGVGRIDWEPSPAPTEHTLWDLASMTKVIGMTTAVMQLVEDGRLELDGPVHRYLPEWTGPNRERVTVRHLLTHSAGLPAWRPLYREALDSAGALALAFATPLDTVPGARMVYSDIGAILLGQVVQRVSGERLDTLLTRTVFAPLGMRETGYLPAPQLALRAAPTEFDPWRQRHLRGEVHDENAHILGGVSAHAGLFGTASDLTRFARMLLGGGTLDGVRIVRSSTLLEFTRAQDPTVSHRALGWETANGANSAGHRMSARAFGHTGFTGTSLWVDPERDAFVLLLTNRVNRTRENRKIGGVRVALADAVMAALGAPERFAPAPTVAAPSSATPSTPQRP